MQKLRDAAHLVSEIDMTLFSDQSTACASIDEKVRRQKFIDDKTGWVDTTENPVLFGWRAFSNGGKCRPNWYDISCLADNDHEDWEQVKRGINLESGGRIHVRKRIGRGNRIIYDRYISHNKPSNTLQHYNSHPQMRNLEDYELEISSVADSTKFDINLIQVTFVSRFCNSTTRGPVPSSYEQAATYASSSPTSFATRI